MKIELIEYSEKSFALFGGTKQIKAELMELGGKFNPFLKYNNDKKAGWIFSNNARNKVNAFLSGYSAVNDSVSTCVPIVKNNAPIYDLDLFNIKSSLEYRILEYAKPISFISWASVTGLGQKDLSIKNRNLIKADAIHVSTLANSLIVDWGLNLDESDLIEMICNLYYDYANATNYYNDVCRLYEMDVERQMLQYAS
jgi:hypothetical protein